MQQINAQLASQLHSRPSGTATSAASTDTLWIGYVPGHTANYWQIGAGAGRPHYDDTGLWTFDQPVHGDSLQGWWPIRLKHTNFSGATLTDEQRPWWALEYGNIANYVTNERRDLNDPSAPGNRTFGVVGVWHRDPGNVVTDSIPGTNPHAPSWTPLDGGYSAYMGLRAHGDLTVQDPQTGNYFNSSTTDFIREYPGTNGATNKLLPGYIGNMDQMLYRDIDLTGAPAATGVTIKFTFRTNMSTDKDTDPRYRTGWHEGDPLSQNQATPGNFISAEAGSPANAEAPIDSFQVYVGAPVDDAAWLTSLGDTRTVYDPQRRWFNEILQRDHRRWLYGAAGDHAASQIVVNLSADERDQLLAAAAAAGHPNRLRLVFRVHTNRAYDDAYGSVPGNYSSGYAGAAVLDDVIADTGGGDTVIGDFEAANAIDNDVAVDPADAWKSTGKPPATYFHPHDISTLVYEDICGPVGSPGRICDMQGAVVSMGIHDMAEAAVDPAPLSTEHEGFWGISSPTINLVTDGTSTPNAWGISGDFVNDLDDFYLAYELYSGYFDVFTTGQLWTLAVQSYPATQADGAKTWGGPETYPCLFFNPEKQCFRDLEGAYSSGLVHTSNPGGVPDSIRFTIFKMSECYRFGVTSCGGPEGAYLDNMSIAVVRNVTPQRLQADIWDLFNDAFPANESPGLPGTAAFDTAAAHVKIGLNTAQTTGDLFRYNVPGDSLTVQASGDSIRLDLMFRIHPGVGNYVTIGNPASGVRQVPTSTTQATPGDGTFWGSYMANPGAFSGPPGGVDPSGATAMHASASGGWSDLVWNSARMDSSEYFRGGQALFPVQGINIGPAPSGAQWCSTYHESELAGPRASLGIPRNRCFIIDTLVTNANDPNVTCGDPGKGPYPPTWVTAVPQSRTGWDGTTTTVEGTKILPDGQLTPGAHVQYFIRRQDLDQPVSTFYMLPDTNVVYPQAGEGNLDGHRWQEFAVLPDRWKDPAFGGIGGSCFLFVDGADRRGDERVWKGAADTLGWTSAADVGAADGYGFVPGTGNINDPQYFIANRNRQLGTYWDAYQVKAGESLTTSAAGIGGRLGYRYAGTSMDDGAGTGKWTYTPPTPDMLAAYYKVILYSTGDLTSNILRPYNDATSDDVGLLENWLAGGNPNVADRALILAGDGIVWSAYDQGAPQLPFISDYLGVGFVDPNYLLYAANSTLELDLPLVGAIDPGGSGSTLGIYNHCMSSLSVLSVNTGVPEASVASYFGTIASGDVSAVYKAHTTIRPWQGLTTGYSLQNLRSRFGASGLGRMAWIGAVLSGAVTPCTGPPYQVDVPGGDARPPADFASLRNNPVRRGWASISFGLARDDRVEIVIYDVVGRRVRTLADRLFKAGEHELVWDGRDDAGNTAPRGVYFTRVRYRESAFETAAKLTILK